MGSFIFQVGVRVLKIDCAFADQNVPKLKRTQPKRNSFTNWHVRYMYVILVSFMNDFI